MFVLFCKKLPQLLVENITFHNDNSGKAFHNYTNRVVQVFTALL